MKRSVSFKKSTHFSGGYLPVGVLQIYTFKNLIPDVTSYCQVKSLAARENIEYSEENSGTIILKIEGRKEYSFTDSDCGEE